MIFGLEPTSKLPKNWTPLDAVAVIKCLDEDGDLAFAIRSTESLSDWECFGMLELAARRQSSVVIDNIEDDDEEEDGEEEMS